MSGQLSMFPEEPAPAAAPAPTPPWTRLTAPGVKCGAQWRHVSGWLVEQCGHPTANYGWTAVTPDGLGPIVSQSGRGWGNGTKAKAGIDALLAGAAVLNENGLVMLAATGGI